MQNFMEISQADLFDITGGGIWGKIGSSLITIGGVIASGCNPISIVIGVVSLIAIWTL